jgi:hypothetical protein
MNAETPTLNLIECGTFLRFWMEVTDSTHVTLVAIVSDEQQTTTATFERGDMDAASDWIGKHQGTGCNIYFQPNETAPGCSRKPGKAEMVAALCRFADVDPQDDSFRSEDERVRLMRLAEHLSKDPDLPPTVIIDSGSGIQIIWAVEREAPLSPDVIARVEGETKAIEEALGAGGTQNVDRLLRLPGTVNCPNRKKRSLGRKVTSARLICSAANMYSTDQAACLADRIAAGLVDTDLVRPHAAKTNPGTHAADADVAALVKAMEAAGAANITQMEDLPFGLHERLQVALAARKPFADRWAGMIDDLSEAGRDSSRSGADMSLAAMARAGPLSNCTKSPQNQAGR